MNYIKDRTYIVTGGAIGLGFEVARQIAELGGNVVVANTNEERAREAVAKLEAMGAKAGYCVTDVVKAEDAINLMKYTKEKFGRIDGVINSAGIMPLGEFHRYSVEKWTRCLDINLKGTVNVTHAAIQVMLEQGGRIPQIVSFASTAAKRYMAGSGIYGATKIAVKWFMDSLRGEFPGQIKFSTIYPGATVGTALGKSNEALPDDKFFGKDSTPFDIAKYMEDLNAEDMDRPFTWGRAETIGRETVHILNQPEGVYIEDVIVTCSNDRA